VDASYSWHPGTGRIVSTWAVPVSLQPDELLSSWLTRAALAHGCDPLILTNELWPKWRIWTKDVDRGLAQNRLRKLAKVSGIKISDFEVTSLRPIATAATSKTLSDHETWLWILALGSRNRKRRGGLQYCPKCLQIDSSPYYRMQWRLAAHTCCPLHQVYLLDKCSYCKASIEPHRLIAMDTHIAICATCKSDLREAKTIQIEMDSLAFQQLADQAVKDECGQYGAISLSSYEWFELSRYFLTILRMAALGKSRGLMTFIKSLGVDTEVLKSPATGLALELLPTQERCFLLAGAWRMLKAGPENFFEATKVSSLSKSYLQDKSENTPLCIKQIIKTPLEKSIYRKRRAQNITVAPKSKQAVSRMWARLQRRKR